MLMAKPEYPSDVPGKKPGAVTNEKPAKINEWRGVAFMLANGSRPKSPVATLPPLTR